MTKPVTPQDVFDMWQKMVNPGAYPLQSLMFPVLDPKEIQKKIAELETVEHWLKANVNMLRLTVQSLQYQLAMLKGGEKARDMLASGEAPQQGEEVPNPAAWAWKMMAEASRGGAAAMKAAGDAAGEAAHKPKAARRRKKGR
jgi:hypothetical protein